MKNDFVGFPGISYKMMNNDEKMTERRLESQASNKLPRLEAGFRVSSATPVPCAVIRHAGMPACKRTSQSHKFAEHLI